MQSVRRQLLSPAASSSSQSCADCSDRPAIDSSSSITAPDREDGPLSRHRDSRIPTDKRESIMLSSGRQKQLSDLGSSLNSIYFLLIGTEKEAALMSRHQDRRSLVARIIFTYPRPEETVFSVLASRVRDRRLFFRSPATSASCV